jgi:hypothetical protein
MPELASSFPTTLIFAEIERSLIRNPENPQSPKLPLYKENLQILPKLRKVESRTKEFILFFAETE